MAFSFAKRWWQPKSLCRTIRKPRASRLSLEHLEDRVVPALVINPIFDGSITNDPNAATIEGTINTAIQNIESSFSNPITVTIQFQKGTSGLGSSSTPYVAEVSYASFRANLAAAATTPYATTAVASLPTGIDNPVNGNADMYLTDPEARALGYSGANPPTGPDGIITLNTSICNLSRSSIDPTKYDLQAVTSHEIDEILGFSSALNSSSNDAPAPTDPVRADDLWRYDQNGVRSFNTTLANQAYFSINGGQTDLARFNQDARGDFSDWYSPGGQTPQVQDAFSTPGATPNLGVELIRLNVDGYTPVPLAAPAGLTATPVSSSQINLSWNSVPGATSYTLEWSTDDQNWNALPGTTATSYSDTGLAAGTTYYFRIQASNILVSSPWSAPASATTTPATPTDVRATTVSSSEIDLSWNSVPGATNYTVERSLVNDPNTSDSNWQVLGTTSGTTWADSGLPSGITYYYSILASNPTGSSPWSAPVNATTTPSAPMGLTATALPPSQINLSWNAVNGAAGGYVIERSSNGSSGWTPIGTTAAGVTTFSDTGLAANTTYYYEVSAVDAGGDSPFSAIVSASTALATPTLTAQGSGSSINLYWNSVAGASNYTVERSLDGQNWSVLNTLGSNYVGYSDTGLAAATTYYYRVQASNAEESSPWSAPASATTVPATPTGVGATAVSSSEIDLSWNSVPGATGYTVERSLDFTNWFVRATTSGTTYSDGGLQGNTVYYYRVSAANATGSSSSSPPVSALTARPRPRV